MNYSWAESKHPGTQLKLGRTNTKPGICNLFVCVCWGGGGEKEYGHVTNRLRRPLRLGPVTVCKRGPGDLSQV